MSTTRNIFFRSATNADKQEIIALVKRILREFHLEYAPASSEKDLDDIEETYTKNKGLFEVIENERHEIIGTIALMRRDAQRCKIRKMYVDGRYRRQGLGQILIERILEKGSLLGYQEFYLETVHTMKEAIALYTKLGFKEQNGLTADSSRCDIVMRRNILEK